MRILSQSIALRISTAHDFRVISARTRVQKVRDFPQTMLDSEINSPFLLNEHGDPRFFQVFAKNSLLKNSPKKARALIG